MNVYIRMGADYKYPLAKNIIEVTKGKAFIDYIDCDDNNKGNLGDRNIEFIDNYSMSSCRMIDEYDISSLKPLDKREYYELLSYESMAIHLGIRETNYPCFSYEEVRVRFYKYIRYWKERLLVNEIKFIVFDETPHNLNYYACYVVARIHNIKTLIFTPTGLNRRYVYGDTIETLGANIGDYYANLSNDEIILSGKVSEYYEDSNNNNNKSSENADIKKKWKKYIYKLEYAQFSVKLPMLKVFSTNFALFLKSPVHYITGDRTYLSKKLDEEYYVKLMNVRLYRRYQSISLKQYDRYALVPNYDERYIYFPLQQYPELTIIPLAGVFRDQYTAIEMLSKITYRYGIKIYVKEYYIQPCRPKWFWNELSKLKNVCFIKSSIPSDKLIAGSVATASQTGTIILESVFANKPAIVFGGGHYWKGMPGVYEIIDEIQGRRVVETIVDGVDIAMSEIKKYMYSIEKNSIQYSINDRYTTEGVSDDDYEKTFSDLNRVVLEKVLANSE